MSMSLRTDCRAVLAAGAAILAGAAAAAPAEGSGHGGPGSTATPIFARELPNVAGKSLVAVEVVYPPGGASPSHRHPASAFIYAYVVSGAIVSAVDNGPARIYRAGESFFEAPGSHHRISRNASKTRPAKLLAVFVKDSDDGKLVFPDPR
jgi:quercetin dioxygenase-like cupin family protein